MPAAVNHRDEPSDTPFDTGRFYRALMPSRAEGVERRQAEAHAEALRDAAIADRDELAAKTDIAGVHSRINALQWIIGIQSAVALATFAIVAAKLL